MVVYHERNDLSWPFLWSKPQIVQKTRRCVNTLHAGVTVTCDRILCGCVGGVEWRCEIVVVTTLTLRSWSLKKKGCRD